MNPRLFAYIQEIIDWNPVIPRLNRFVKYYSGKYFSLTRYEIPDTMPWYLVHFQRDFPSVSNIGKWVAQLVEQVVRQTKKPSLSSDSAILYRTFLLLRIYFNKVVLSYQQSGFSYLNLHCILLYSWLQLWMSFHTLLKKVANSFSNIFRCSPTRTKITNHSKHWNKHSR